MLLFAIFKPYYCRYCKINFHVGLTKVWHVNLLHRDSHGKHALNTEEKGDILSPFRDQTICSNNLHRPYAGPTMSCCSNYLNEFHKLTHFEVITTLRPWRVADYIDIVFPWGNTKIMFTTLYPTTMQLLEADLIWRVGIYHSSRKSIFFLIEEVKL